MRQDKKKLNFLLSMMLVLLCTEHRAQSTEHREDKLRILFIGNSITRHQPNLAIGWSGNYRMAVTSMENDYVHKFLGRIKKNILLKIIC